MKYQVSSIPDVIVIEPIVYGDERGFFLESWRDDEFKKHVADVTFVQDNHSMSGQGVLRGLHYQVKSPQGKLVRVTMGEVFDVAVDLRKNSNTFGKWVGVVLSSEKKNMIWVPPGFAHGFYVISKSAEFMYKCTDYYAPEYERSIVWNDPEISVKWPIQENQKPILSDKDMNGSRLCDSEVFI